MTTVAVFGGSFNPPHIAHQMVCLYVLETESVDQILIVPTFRHPFEKQLAPFSDRVEMCQAMAAPFGTRAVVSTLEAELGGEASLTLRTLEALAARMPGVGLRLVIGADILAETPKWYRWNDVAALAPPLVVGRSGFPGDTEVELPAVSSTRIRSKLSAGESARGLVPRTVLQLIEMKGLYRAS